MEQLVLNQKALDTIKTDHETFGRVAMVLGISPMTLPKMILQNDKRLTQASVMKILREVTGIKKDSELLTDSLIPAA